MKFRCVYHNDDILNSSGKRMELFEDCGAVSVWLDGVGFQTKPNLL